MGHRLHARVPSHFALAAAALAAALATSCGEGAPTDAFELSGRVTVFNEGGAVEEPIPDALVTFVSDTLIVEETRTDDGGRYRMRVLTDFPFGEVKAEAEGFIPGQGTVYFDSPQRRVDLVLRRVAAP